LLLNYFRNRPFLLLSVVFHLGLVFALGPGGRPETGVKQHNALTVDLLQSRQPPSVPTSVHAEHAASTQVNVADDALKEEDALAEDAGDPGPVAEAAASQNPLVPLPAPVEPRYYRAQDLTERPRVLQDIEPWLRLEIDGVRTQAIVLRLLINEYGDIDKVEIDRSDLSPAAEAAVADAFSKIRFLPGKLDAASVKSQMKIEVTLEAPSAAPVIVLEEITLKKN
jgi:hypothetical protein